MSDILSKTIVRSEEPTTCPKPLFK
jgi:hypothetical protein